MQTKTSSRRIFFAFALILALAFAFYIIAAVLRHQPSLFESGEAGATSWSLGSWETVERGPDGVLLRTIHEPLALYRNIALILLAMMGLSVGVRELIGKGRPRVVDVAMISAKEIESFRRQFVNELQAVLELFQSHSRENQTFSAALKSGQVNLAACRGGDQIHSAIKFLVSAS